MNLVRLIPSRGSLPPLPSATEITSARSTPVVFLHGWLASPGNFEQPITKLLRQGIPVAAPGYGNRGTVAVADSLAQVRGQLEKIVAVSATGQIDVVGHSLGAVLAIQLAHELPVRTLVGLAPAYDGLLTALPGWLVLLASLVLGPGIRDIARPHPWDIELPARTRVVSIVSTADRVVKPTAVGDVVDIHGVRHEHMPAQTAPIIDALQWRP